MKFWRRHYLVIDTIAVVAVGLLMFVWSYLLDGSTFVETIFSANRTNIYGFTATIAATLLGFSLTIISVVVGFVSYERLAAIRSSRHYATLWETFFSTVTALIVLLLISLMGLLLDRDYNPILWLEMLFFIFYILCGVRLWRSIIVLKKIVWLVVMPSGDDTSVTDEET